MAVCTAGFELGASGSAVAAADAGNQTAFTSVTIVAGGTLAYDNARAQLGAQSCKVATGGTSGQAMAVWGAAALGTVTDHYGRLFAWFGPSLPASGFQLVAFLSGASAAANLTMTGGTGKLSLRDSANVQQAVFANAVQVNQWVRIEWRVVHSASVGMIQVQLFNTAGSSSFTEQQTTAASINTLASADTVRLGMASSTTGIGPFWVDGLVAGAAAYPGPGLGTAGSLLLTGVGS